MKTLTKLAIAATAALTFTAGIAQAQTSKRMINVLVVAQDDDTGSIPGSNYAVRTVISEVKEQLRPYGYNVMDLDAMLADLNWGELDNRVSRRDKFAMVKAACSDGNSRTCPRMVAFVETRVEPRKIGNMGGMVYLNMSGDVADARNNNSMGNWRAVEDTFTSPNPCDTNCASRVIANNAQDVAAQLGDVLRIKLDDALAVLEPDFWENTGSQQADLRTDYFITFRNFGYAEVASMLDVMDTSFGARGELGEAEVRLPVWKQNYASDHNTTELTGFFYTLLGDMGYGESEFRVTTQGSDITVEKLQLMRR